MPLPNSPLRYPGGKAVLTDFLAATINANGLGDAVYHASRHVGDEPFAVLLGDNIIHSKVPATRQLMECYARFGHSVVGVEVVPEERIPRYGIVDGKRIEDNIHEVI